MERMFTSGLIVLLGCHAVLSQGTTPNLVSIFKGRCFDYIGTKRGGLATFSDVNCDDLWSNFSSAFENKAPCEQGSGNYDNVFSFYRQTLPKDKSLFWSGVKDFAHKLSGSGRRFVTLEDTLVGFIADGLGWCGTRSAPGINYTSCPAYRACPAEAVYSFWIWASKWFALASSGEVQVVLNGSNPNRKAYTKDSIFASIELAAMRSDVVTKVTTILVHDLGKPKVESCGTLSVAALESDVRAKNIDFACVENPPEVSFLLCLDSPDSPECVGLSSCDDPSSGAAGLIKPPGRTGVHFVAMATFVMLCVMFGS